MRKVYLSSYEDLPAWCDEEHLSNNGVGKEDANYIVIEDGSHKVVYSDAVEPEDTTFGRDFSWIVEEIGRLLK